MADEYPTHTIQDDWAFYAAVADTGTSVLTGADDVYEFVCDGSGSQTGAAAETGDEYIKLALASGTQDNIVQICLPDWPLDQLAADITSGIPNDLYVLDGSPSGTCGQINPATITVVVNGIPLAPADWNYTAGTCTLQITNNVPVIGDNVVIVYENF
jgi:hypothetical protein